MARTTNNVVRKNVILDVLGMLPIPQELASIPCQLPPEGIVNTNNTSTMVRFTSADEDHLNDCAINGTLKTAIRQSAEYFRVCGLHNPKIDMRQLVNDTKPATLNAFTLAGRLQSEEKVDRSDLTCGTDRANITALEPLDQYSVNPDPAGGPGTPMSFCVDNRSDLVGRFNTNASRSVTTWATPTGYNNYTIPGLYFTIKHSAENISYNISSLLCLMFGLYYNGNVNSTISMLYCLRNITNSFLNVEYVIEPRNFVLKYFGSPEPTVESKPAVVVNKREKLPSVEVNIVSEESQAPAVRSNKPKDPPPPMSNPDESKAESTGTLLTKPRPKPGTGRGSGNQSRKRNVSTQAISYKPLNRETLLRTKLLNSMVSHVLQE